MWKPGESGNPRGRKPGVPNKLTSDIRAAIEEAFDKAGGVEYLIKLARNKPEVFARLLGQIIPRELRVQGAISINSVIDALLLRRAERADADALKLKDAECKVLPPAAIPGGTVAKPVQVPAPGVGNTNHESSNTDTGEAKRAQP